MRASGELSIVPLERVVAEVRSAIETLQV